MSIAVTHESVEAPSDPSSGMVVSRERRVVTASHPAPRPPSALTAARELNRQREADAAALSAAARDAAYLRYTTILARNASPEPGDAEELAGLMQQLALTDREVETDAKAIREHQRLIPAHERTGEARDARQKAASEYVAYVEESRKEGFRLRRESVAADDRHHTCIEATRRLRELQRQRPELFVPGTDPPQLRVETPED